ncbi:MAG TPA: hypothetical protein VFN67_21535 [Polyangiales bacterium]|nr:hypothetical protein [Polyangiales bacterium]
METAIEQVQLAFRERPHMQSGPAVAWFTHPAGCVFQLVQPARITLEVSSFIVDDVYEEMLRRFPDSQSITLVLDFSLMLGRTTASRSQLLGCMRSAVGRVRQVYLALPPDIRPALKRSFQASIQMANDLGIEMRLTGSARHAVASSALVCAPSASP